MGLLPLPSARRVLSAACLSFSLFLAAGCVPQQLTRAPADSGPQTATSKTNTATASKPADAPAPAPRKSLPVPAIISIDIPIKKVEVSSNPDRISGIFANDKSWCSSSDDAARWVKIYFDGPQTLHELSFDTNHWEQLSLSFSDGSSRNFSYSLSDHFTFRLGDKKTEWIVFQRSSGSSFRGEKKAAMCFSKLSVIGAAKDASPEQIVQIQMGDDQMPFEAGSFVWKGGREGLGNIPLFLSHGKVFVVTTGQYSYADAMSWCERLSEATGTHWRRIGREEFSVLADRVNVNSVDFNGDFQRYFHRRGKVARDTYTLFDRGDVAAISLRSVDFHKNRAYSRPEALYYRPFCVAQDLRNIVSREDPKDPHVANIQSVVHVVARSNLLAKCATGGKLAMPVKMSVSLTRGEFEKTADFERRTQKAEREAELAYQQALKKHAQAQQAANADCEKEKQAQSRGWSIQYSAAVLNALTGYPQIRSAVYDADAEVFNLQIGNSDVVPSIPVAAASGRAQRASARRGSEGSSSIPVAAPSEVSSLIPVTVPVKIRYAEDFKKMLLAKDFKPTVHVRVDNAGVMRVAYIEELQNPEDRVVNAAWAAAQGNVDRLNAFIVKFPEEKKRVAEARQQIVDIQKAHALGAEAVGRLLLWGIQKTGEAIREGAEWRRQHCKYVRVDGVEHEVCEH
jgi:hypothetical protein